MLPGYQRKCNIWGGIAMVGIFGGIALVTLVGGRGFLGDVASIMLLVGWIGLMVGGCVLSAAKGYSPVLGLLSLVIVALLPDQHPMPKVQTPPQPEQPEKADAA